LDGSVGRKQDKTVPDEEFAPIVNERYTALFEKISLGVAALAKAAKTENASQENY